ncbi:chitobiase/beta-hexosaminidase C-terminal domain-containing protein [Butyrivibrio sp. MC2013]|uniref:chitobiase/beta-hexosaminidase C-terminal domain-containing protein n=1 Tax=Butyrivibrio sp. MC2013 TaxID=1280686 RepID=UPI000412BEB8|nr:chitobiase/beta-hexosaminidase C-terminal domain-containing protein [Butyrivibrio sp. MC2013]
MKCPRCGADIPEEALLCPECGEDIKFVPEYDPEFENSMSESLSELAGDFGKLTVDSKTSAAADDMDEDDIEAEREFDANEEGHILGSPVLTICFMCLLLIALGFGAFEFVTKSGVLSFEKDMKEEVSLTDNIDALDEATADDTGDQENGAGEDAASNEETSDDSSEESSEEELIAPPEPTVLEDSGEYSEVTQIVAVAQAGSSVFYTTDGTEPGATAVRYTEPIAMPYGESVFKFVAVDDVTGAMSDIVEREYSFHYPVQFSHEQAVSALLNELIAKGYLLDGMGTVAGMEGYNLYIIQKTEVIDGADYYVITENHVYPDGSQTQSGLLFGVNVTSGLVYRLGSDEQGNYFLKPLT